MEVIDLLNEALAEFLTACHDGLAGVKDQFVNFQIHLSGLLLAVVDGAQQNLEWHLELLALGESHHVQGAHETKEAGSATTGNLPMLLEQVERQNSIHIFSAKTLSESSNWVLGLLGIREAAMSIWVCLKIEDCLVLIGLS